MVVSKIEKKRAYDREAQRTNRAKTKAYIRHLEETVETLSKGGCATSPPNVYTAQQQAKINHLETIVGQIRDIMQNADNGLLPSSESLFQTRPGKSAIPISPDASPSSHKSPHELDCRDRTHARPPCSQQDLRLWTGLDHVSAHCAGELDNFFLILSNAIEDLEMSCTHEPLADAAEDEDILVRVTVFGWEAVALQRGLDRVWRFLRTIDEGIWRQTEPLQKMVGLRLLRWMLIHRIRPLNQCRRSVPPFMAKTSLQQTSSYPLLIDYVAWPSVRNYMVYHGTPYMCVNTAAKFATHFRFGWDYELRDAYMVNKVTGRYKLSSAFLDALDDINSYNLLPFHAHVPAVVPNAPNSTAKIPEDFLFDLFSELDQVNYESLSDESHQFHEGVSGISAKI